MYAPPPGPKFLNFHAVSGKIGQIVCWCPLRGWYFLLCETLDPPLTVVDFFLVLFLTFKFVELRDINKWKTWSVLLFKIDEELHRRRSVIMLQGKNQENGCVIDFCTCEFYPCRIILFFHWAFCATINKQESPPAWTQEAYAMLLWGGTPCHGGGTPAGGVTECGTPTGPGKGVPPISWMAYPLPRLDLGRGYPPPVNWIGYPPSWTWEGGTPPPPHSSWMRYSPPPRCELTDKLKIYAGGN